MATLSGLHHVTCIAGDPQENLTFYTGALGMRLVKKSVNQDAPDTYHLFFADADGHPGTDLTFFPWPNMPAAQPGTGLANEVALAVPPGSLPYWRDRLAAHGVAVVDDIVRRDEHGLAFRDPHGLPLVLVETAAPRLFTPWRKSPVPAERQVRGLHAVRLWERRLDSTARFLVDVLGFRELGERDGWHAYGLGSGRSGEYLEVQEVEGGRVGRWGTGGIHHVAWRVDDTTAARAVRARVAEAGLRPTDLIDRFWFTSVYFREPGGTLFELATDGPGFTADEPHDSLGETLVLPPWLEPYRERIEAELIRIE